MLDLQAFFDNCNPSRTLVFDNLLDRRYYIDFAQVRGAKVIDQLQRTITKLSPHKPTCQLFSGHIGCGKSTELRRLEALLKQQGFHVVYFESTQDLDTADMGVTDVMLAITRQVSENLENFGIKLKPGYLGKLLNEIIEFLQTPIEVKAEAEISLPLKIGKITAKTRDSPNLRSKLRQYLEPQTNNILQLINEEVIERGNQELAKRGNKGLVVIVDNLDRVDPRIRTTERSQSEYLFVDRGEQLRRLNCHVVYTIPLVLMFSNEVQRLTNHLGGGVAPKILPMVPVRLRDGREHEEGMAQLRQMVLARAFPTVGPEERLNLIAEVFDDTATLDRLCSISGGHVRNLLGILYSCLQAQDPPISRECLEDAIRSSREILVTAITDDEWELLREFTQRQRVAGEDGYQTLLHSLFMFEYQDKEGRWFGINPLLAEAPEFQRCTMEG